MTLTPPPPRRNSNVPLIGLIDIEHPRYFYSLYDPGTPPFPQVLFAPIPSPIALLSQPISLLIEAKTDPYGCKRELLTHETKSELIRSRSFI